MHNINPRLGTVQREDGMRYNPEVGDYCEWGDRDDSGAHGAVVELSRCDDDNRLARSYRLAIRGTVCNVMVCRASFSAPWHVDRTIGVQLDDRDLIDWVRSL